jgi:two-component system response regulator TrcR
VVAVSRDAEQDVKSPKRLMIVDDQVSLTKIVTMIAEQMGLCVHVVNDSTTALDAYLEHRPDILMLDMIMPEKDGVDVLNEIMLTGIDSQVILTSGFTESYARLAANVAQFHNKEPVLLLKKPFRRDKLIAVLREALDRG